MIAVLQETIRENHTRHTCLTGIVFIGIIELGRLLFMPEGWSGTLIPLALLRTVATGLFLVAFFPPLPLRKLRYMVFFLSVVLLAGERVIWTFFDAFGSVKTPAPFYAMNAALIVLIVVALLFGGNKTYHQSATAAAMTAILSFLLLVYAFS